MKAWTHAEYMEALGQAIDRMVHVIGKHGMSVPVPTCPGWDVGALVAHTGTIHRWAAAMVRDLAQERYDRRTMDFGVPEDRAAYPAWLADGKRILSEAFHGRDPETPMWTLGGERRLGFWARRQLHETTVHRADAEIALGVTPRIDEDVAADGVGEFFTLLPGLARRRPQLKELVGEGETLSWQADTGAGWVVTLTPEGVVHEISARPGAVTVRASSSADLLLLVWGRRRADDYSVEGDAALLDWWLEHAKI